MPRKTRDLPLGVLPLFLQCLAARFQDFSGATVAPFGRFVAVLPLFDLLPGAVDFLMGAIFNGAKM